MLSSSFSGKLLAVSLSLCVYVCVTGMCEHGCCECLWRVCAAPAEKHLPCPCFLPRTLHHPVNLFSLLPPCWGRSGRKPSSWASTTSAITVSLSPSWKEAAWMSKLWLLPKQSLPGSASLPGRCICSTAEDTTNVPVQNPSSFRNYLCFLNSKFLPKNREKLAPQRPQWDKWLDIRGYKCSKSNTSRQNTPLTTMPLATTVLTHLQGPECALCVHSHAQASHLTSVGRAWQDTEETHPQ